MTPSSEGYKPEWLEIEKALGTRPILSGTLQEITESYDTLTAALAAQAGPPDSSVQTHDASTSSGIPVRIYTPSHSSTKRLPLGVYFHGGGWVLGTLDSEDSWCRYVAKNTPCIIVSVDYRLAPKLKMPTMLEDCVEGFEWARQEASSLNADQSRVFTIGSSVGGGLALAVADAMTAKGNASHVQGIVAIVPVTAHPSSVPDAYKQHYSSYEENKSGVPIIDASSMDTFFEAAGVDFQDPGTFPTLSNNLASFPSTYISTCAKDPLRDDGKVMEMMLKDNGVETKSDHYEGVPHYFWMFPGIKGGEEVLANVCEGVRFVLGA
ncbi:hypothetical protein CJF31_00002318 [Rutstroemia sp. NJR-2017a BVV2]|nr:hypothetical protein CJF31_00002318 [Rutstroemia sp. NJR-2017a BVV2]